MTISCPACGEQSTELDYCSNYGHKLGGSAATGAHSSTTRSTRSAAAATRSARSVRGAQSARSFVILLAASTDYLGAARIALAANSAPLKQRDELAGLLRARRAQAQDLARLGLYLPPAAEEAFGRAQDLLAQHPCRLADIEPHVRAYDAEVATLATTAASARRRLPG